MEGQGRKAWGGGGPDTKGSVCSQTLHLPRPTKPHTWRGGPGLHAGCPQLEGSPPPGGHGAGPEGLCRVRGHRARHPLALVFRVQSPKQRPPRQGAPGGHGVRSEAGTLPPPQKTAAGSFPAARDHRSRAACDSQECHRLSGLNTREQRFNPPPPSSLPKGLREGKGGGKG